MNNLGRKLCLFLFLTARLAGRNNSVGVLTGAITGSILLWPVYRRLLTGSRPRKQLPVEEQEEAEATFD